MQVSFKPYTKRDGSLMLYINGSNGACIGLCGSKGFAPFGKDGTPGKRNAFEAAFRAFRAHATPFTGDLAIHKEGGFAAPVSCGQFTLVGTDGATIGGMTVPADGPYIIYDGLILRCGTYDEPTAAVDDEE